MEETWDIRGAFHIDRIDVMTKRHHHEAGTKHGRDGAKGRAYALGVFKGSHHRYSGP
jgi:hypothetical protein